MFTIVKSKDGDLVVVEKEVADSAYGKLAEDERISKTYRVYIMFDELRKYIQEGI